MNGKAGVFQFYMSESTLLQGNDKTVFILEKFPAEA
jgi:hypothetical protein